MDKTHSTTPTKYFSDQLVTGSLSAAAVGLPEAVTLWNSGEACLAEHQVRSADAPTDSSTALVLDQATTTDAQHQLPSSIENIPVEVFQGIMWEVMQEVVQEWSSVKGYYADITRIRLVCRAWTGILEGMPEVWARLSPCMDERFLDLALSRSVHCPLVIKGRFLSSPALDKLLLHIYRWKDLDIMVYEPDVLDRIAVLSVPLLEKLGLHLGCSPRAILFNGSAPKLEIVHISSYGIQWATSALSNLRELVLLYISEGAPDVDTFLELLSHSPRLTRLQVWQTHLIRSPSPQTRVSLSHLEYLELDDLGHGVVKQLVESIDVPTSTRCLFGIALNDLETSLYEQLEPIGLRLSNLANVSRGTRSTLTLNFQIGELGDFKVSYEGDADQHGKLTTYGELTTDDETRPQIRLKIFEYFARRLGRTEPDPLPPILHIIMLGYGDSDESDSKILGKLCMHLPNTDEIQFEDPSPLSMENALNALFPSDLSSRLFPRLSTLTIRDAEDETWADWLLKRQERQDKQGGVDPLPLTTLKIEGGSLSAEKVEGLRKLVPNVDLDGVEVA
ncbi:hypothetical protein FRC04_001400 [Tulasnella sp. 424]|nr:hypothetical protein FRC04_001400 [Tulasnella sp. 424]KAG8968838.1 hypothetical protein FRC05_001324 [Tulasnella sp. 425]